MSRPLPGQAAPDSAFLRHLRSPKIASEWVARAKVPAKVLGSTDDAEPRSSGKREPLDLRTQDEIDYAALAAAYPPTSETWDAFVGEMLEPAWLSAYRAATTWSTEIQEIRLDALVFLFDAAPTLKQMP